MGFEITKGAIFYIVLMLIIIYLTVSIITGLTPFQLIKKIGTAFEPGKLYVANDQRDPLEAHTKIECLSAAYKVVIDSPNFYYKDKSSSKSITFAVVLDYRNKLFFGDITDPTGAHSETISCSPPADSDEFSCPKDRKIEFNVNGIGTFDNKQVLHFTTWIATPAVISALKESDATLDKMLGGVYANSYLSSFDIVVDTQQKCKEAECNSLDESGCKTKNSEGCYWRTSWLSPNSCQLCGSSTKCGDYDGEACVQCPIAKANCKPGVLYGCNTA